MLCHRHTQGCRIMTKEKKMKAKAMIAAAMMCMTLLPAAAADLPGWIPTISVSGYAEVSMQPDTASFSITAAYTEPTTEEARRKTSEMIASAVAILKDGFGVEEKDISTSYISAYPEYRWVDDEKVLEGQRASQTIDVTIGGIDRIGDIYTRLMGLDGITLSDVSLDKANKDAEYRKARMDAVRDAREKAEAYAQAAGVSVGNVLSISDGSSYAAPLYRSSNLMLASAEAASADRIPTEFYSGEITVSASISMVYAISDEVPDPPQPPRP